MQVGYATDECIVQPWWVNESRCVMLRPAAAVPSPSRGGSSPSLAQTPPVTSCVHGVNCVTSPPVYIAGPALAPANNDHQGRGEHNEVDKSTMMMDCAAIKARGLKQFHRSPRRQGDSIRPAGAARCSVFRFLSLYFRGMRPSIMHRRSHGGQDYIRHIATLSIRGSILHLRMNVYVETKDKCWSRNFFLIFLTN